MQVCQFFPGRGEGGKLGSEGNPRQFALEAGSVALAVFRKVQGVEVVEDSSLAMESFE